MTRIMTKVLKVKEIVEKPIYTTDEMYHLRKFLMAEIRTIDHRTIDRLAKEAHTTANDLIIILGLHESKLIDVRAGKRRFSYKEKLLIYLFNALYEHKPMLKLTVLQGVRSYWVGWSEAGGELPKDIQKLIGEYDDDFTINFKDYRQGVIDFGESKRKENNDN